MKKSILVLGLSLALLVFSGSDLLAQASKEISVSMLYGSGKYTYELVDEWAKLPQGWTFTDGAGIAIDSSDNVYILSRGTHPVTIWNRDGNLLGNWGGEIISHGLTRRLLVQTVTSGVPMMETTPSPNSLRKVRSYRSWAQEINHQIQVTYRRRG